MKRIAASGIVLLFAVATAMAADKADPTGTWKWSVEVNGQKRESTLKLKLDGDKLTGAMVGRNGQETPIEDATFKNGEVSFKVTRERNGQKTTTKYTGKIAGDTLKGKIMPDREGAQGRDFEAARSKD